MSFDQPLTITFSRKASEGDLVTFSLSALIAESELSSGVLDPEEVVLSVCRSLHAGIQAACVARLEQIVDDQRSILEGLA